MAKDEVTDCVVISGNETDSGLRGPADGEGVVVVVLPESTATEAATTTAVPFTA